VTIYKVELIDHSHYVMGLPTTYRILRTETEPNTLLAIRYQEGDIDTKMTTKKYMHSALYDLFQTSDQLKQGDVFDTEYGYFICESVHVLPARKVEVMFTLDGLTGYEYFYTHHKGLDAHQDATNRFWDYANEIGARYPTGVNENAYSITPVYFYEGPTLKTTYLMPEEEL
jgi:hypothetical protein